MSFSNTISSFFNLLNFHSTKRWRQVQRLLDNERHSVSQWRDSVDVPGSHQDLLHPQCQVFPLRLPVLRDHLHLVDLQRRRAGRGVQQDLQKHGLLHLQEPGCFLLSIPNQILSDAGSVTNVNWRSIKINEKVKLTRIIRVGAHNAAPEN